MNEFCVPIGEFHFKYIKTIWIIFDFFSIFFLEAGRDRDRDRNYDRKNRDRDYRR
jgi:hypothetical protein